MAKERKRRTGRMKAKERKRRTRRMKAKGNLPPKRIKSKKGLDAPGVNDAEEQAKMKARKKERTKAAKPPGTPTKSDQRTDKESSLETGKPVSQPPTSSSPRQPSMPSSKEPKKRGLFETFKTKAKAAARAVKSSLGLTSQPGSRKRGQGRWRIGLG